MDLVPAAASSTVSEGNPLYLPLVVFVIRILTLDSNLHLTRVGMRLLVAGVCIAKVLFLAANGIKHFDQILDQISWSPRSSSKIAFSSARPR
jgi:hypothetical protein